MAISLNLVGVIRVTDSDVQRTTTEQPYFLAGVQVSKAVYEVVHACLSEAEAKAQSLQAEVELLKSSLETAIAVEVEKRRTVEAEVERCDREIDAAHSLTVETQAEVEKLRSVLRRVDEAGAHTCGHSDECAVCEAGEAINV